ncbi:NADH-quinone oxidoreductase subunit G [bacterium HR16]|nr:NADH-quinone oxidoreductase subunit G [bacterium HR16]
MAEQELVTIEINGIELQVPKGEMIIESAKRIGVDIPFFCYHPRLGKGQAANCRMCLVEAGTKQPDGSVRMMPKPQTSCTLPASQGLVVFTDTVAIQKARRGILEFLLINHPLDCPICDRGGECPLQNNTLFYGPGVSRFVEEKRHLPKAFPISDYVVLDRERCIHCARCTRFSQEISGDAQLDFLKRGADMMVSTFYDTEFTSRFSGNTIELCPVGALTSRVYRFRARPWDMKSQKSICTRCSNGCNIWLDYRPNRLVRVLGRENEAVNEEWTCDRGKFGHEYISSDRRLLSPLIRKDGKFVTASWVEAYQLIASRVRQAVQEHGAGSVGAIGGAHLSNEEAYVLQKLMRVAIGTNNIDHRLEPNQPRATDGLFGRFGVPFTQNAIADIEKAKTIFILGSELVDEQPIVFLRARKAWFRHGAKVVIAYPEVTETELRFDEPVVLRYREGTESTLVNGLLHLVLASGKAVTDGIAQGEVQALRETLREYTPEKVAEMTGVETERLREAADLLGEGTVILCGAKVRNHPRYAETVHALANLTILTGNADRENGGLNILLPEVNSHGAADMGVLPDVLPGYARVDDDAARQRIEGLWEEKLPAEPGMSTQAMLEAAARGQMQVLYIIGEDIAQKYHDTELAQRALESAGLVVVQDLFLTETAQYADVVLPAASVAEKEGTFTNTERRVQRFWKAFNSPSPDVKSDLSIFTELAVYLGKSIPVFSAEQVMDEIGQVFPAYAACRYDNMPAEGVRVQASAVPSPQLVPVQTEVPAV